MASLWACGGTASEGSGTDAGAMGATGGANGTGTTGGTGGAGAPLGASGSQTSNPAASGASPGGAAECSFQGQIHPDGTSFPAGAACEYQGQTYESGAQFAAGDGCNTCGCTDGMVQCTALWCEPLDAGSDAAAGDAGDVDPRVLDVWHFDILTGAIRWYQIALCEGNRALVWTSFSGSGEPDQDTPIEGTWEGSGLVVTVVYDDPSDAGGPQSIRLEYNPDRDALMTVGNDGGGLWGGTDGVRLAPLSSVVFRLSCE